MNSLERIPKFSIITVALNNRQGLENTYNSLKSQDLQSIATEWIIVDGMSEDGSFEFISGIANREVGHFNIQLYSRPPLGIYEAMNFGASKATGEYLLFLNAGDFFIDAELSSSIIKEFEENSYPDCLAFPVAHFTSDGFLYDISIPKKLNGQFHIHHQGAFLSRSIFNLVGGYDTSLRWAADGKLLDQVAKIGTIGFGKTMNVGFEIGGASGRNFKELLVEITSYRENSLGAVQLCILIFKNSIKLKIIDFHLRKQLRITHWYYKKRQKSLIQHALRSDNLDCDWLKLSDPDF
jgi:glycosyltransferase involved in cell wall biosynthesis